MHVRVVAAVLTACQILITSPLLAQDLPSRAEKRAYHACLYASFIDNYCRFHAWGFGEQAFRECVIANGACECSYGASWGSIVEDVCRPLSQARGF